MIYQTDYIFQIKQKKNKTKKKNRNLIVFNSPWDQSQIGIKLGAKRVIYQKLATFLRKKGISVNRLESVIFGI